MITKLTARDYQLLKDMKDDYLMITKQKNETNYINDLILVNENRYLRNNFHLIYNDYKYRKVNKVAANYKKQIINLTDDWLANLTKHFTKLNNDVVENRIWYNISNKYTILKGITIRFTTDKFSYIVYK